MKLELSDGAVARISEARQAESVPAEYAFRLKVRGAGCGGFSYDMYFDVKREGDVAVTVREIDVLVDPASVPYLHGTKVDVSPKGFLFDNPNAGSYCACGASFMPKF